MKKALPPKYAYVHGVQDVEKPQNLQLAIRGNPMKLGDEVPRALPHGVEPGDADAASRRAADGWSSRTSLRIIRSRRA